MLKLLGSIGAREDLTVSTSAPPPPSGWPTSPSPRRSPFCNAGLSFAYGLYAVFAALSFGFVLKAVKETKGRELEDMT